MGEDFDVADRGRFYDPVGAMRDVVQNHLLQVLSYVAMEPPTGRGDRRHQQPQARRLRRDGRGRPAHYVRGQYRGYLDVEGVAPDSQTETFCAMRSRSTTGAGPASPSSSARASRSRRR
jgi:glucose-6-phosphate 1-dehydrogenase